MDGSLAVYDEELLRAVPGSTLLGCSGRAVMSSSQGCEATFSLSKPVMCMRYFVSHSWGTSFVHFVRSIRHHAEFVAGDAWRHETYWVCSFSNNQWDVAGALGTTIMESAFARVLTSGKVPDVVMVMDAEVQPLTRVWCLFELLLTKMQDLGFVFASDVGIIGDRRCTSIDVALATGRKINELKIAHCGASSEEDRRNIFDFIIRELGSLDNMDTHIRDVMSQVIHRAIQHAHHSSDELIASLRKVGGEAPACELVAAEIVGAAPVDLRCSGEATSSTSEDSVLSVASAGQLQSI